ncbi:MAG: glycoside hydrolase family 5 protein [Clostridia bacterium]|nr:glycoside hydrolase family 5 protein [Clostridia bacterium]
MNKLIALVFACMLIITVCTAEGGVTVPDITYVKPYEIPDNEAMRFLRSMGVGWNLGNTFDATRSGYVSNEMAIEWEWVGVPTSQEMIRMLKDAGFGTIRIPVSWHNHVDNDFNISEKWISRVQEVVDWAIALDMHVIINIHHDNEPEFFYPSDEHMETAEKYVRSIWTQVAVRFRDYDHKLIFEALNEPRLKGTDLEWVFQTGNPRSQESARCINRLNQVFVDTVRASGGQNADRYLMVPGYAASVDGVTNEFFALPQDTADNRIMVSVHAYTPYSFALEDGGTDTFAVTNIGQTTEITMFMNRLYKKYIANGVPVVLGEFGARDKGGNQQSRVNFTAFYMANAAARNIPCVWWDNNGHRGSGELFGLLNRAKLHWAQPEIVEALIRYGGYDQITGK